MAGSISARTMALSIVLVWVIESTRLTGTRKLHKEFAMKASSVFRVISVCGLLFPGALAVIRQIALAQGTQIPQGYSSQNWLTTNADAQRDSWVRTDPHISVQSVKGFGVVRKVKVEGSSATGGLTSQVTTEVAAGGYKSMGYLIDASGTVVGFDSDTSQIFWKNPLYAAAVADACAAAVTPGLARVGQSLVPVSPPYGGIELSARIRVRQPPAGGAVGEPFRGAPNLNLTPPVSAGGASGRGPAGPGFRAAGGGIFGLSPDGMLHQLSMLKGFDFQLAPRPFLPPNVAGAGLIAVEDFVYVATVHHCNGVPDGIWGVNPSSPDKSVVNWKTNGGSIAGTAGAAFGSDGTIYAATAEGGAGADRFSSSVVALEPKTLKLKDYFSPGKPGFVSSPVILVRTGKDLIVTENSDGRLYMSDNSSLGGPDHKTPLNTSTKFANFDTDYIPGALAAWQDASGTCWVLAPVGGAPAPETKFPVAYGNIKSGAIAAFKVVDKGGLPTLEPGWISHDMTSPQPPMIINGVVFVLASGEYHGTEKSLSAQQRAQRSTPAVLYALDGTSGKELWNSGSTLGLSVHSAGLSSVYSTVYLTTTDNTLWAFGLPQDKQ